MTDSLLQKEALNFKEIPAFVAEYLTQAHNSQGDQKKAELIIALKNDWLDRHFADLSEISENATIGREELLNALKKSKILPLSERYFSGQGFLRSLPGELEASANLFKELKTMAGDNLAAADKAIIDKVSEKFDGKVKTSLGEGKISALEELLGKVETDVETAEKSKGLFHSAKQFFKHDNGHLNKTRVSLASVAGIGIAGGALYLLTRQKETPQERQSWQDRVNAHAEQQGISAQR